MKNNISQMLGNIFGSQKPLYNCYHHWDHGNIHPPRPKTSSRFPPASSGNKSTKSQSSSAATASPYLPSLKLTVSPWKWAIHGHPKRKGLSSNHPFSGAMSVSFREWVCLSLKFHDVFSFWIILKQLITEWFLFVRWLNMSFHQWIYSCTLMWFLIKEGTLLSSFINKRKGIGKKWKAPPTA